MAYDHIRILNTLFASGVWYEMTLSEVRVYVAICSHWNWQRLEAYPAINTLAEETQLSRRGVIYAIEKLRDKGLIRVVKKGRKNYYQIFDYLFKMASRSISAKTALIDWIGADFDKTSATDCPNKCTRVHHHINYTINHTTITNSFNVSGEKTEPDYLKQMRRDLIISGKYRIPDIGWEK
ncbi:MAG: helix-turn-helix domain-containing protein [Candidatus Omnitrophota bacterium]